MCMYVCIYIYIYMHQRNKPTKNLYPGCRSPGADPKAHCRLSDSVIATLYGFRILSGLGLRVL